MLPLDVYLENESEIEQKSEGGVAEDFKETIAGKLLKKDPKSRVVINFHGVSLLVCEIHINPHTCPRMLAT